MQALRVLKDLDAIESDGLGLLSALEVVNMNEFVLQRTKEILGAGVVAEKREQIYLILYLPGSSTGPPFCFTSKKINLSPFFSAIVVRSPSSRTELGGSVGLNMRNL